MEESDIVYTMTSITNSIVSNNTRLFLVINNVHSFQWFLSVVLPFAYLIQDIRSHLLNQKQQRKINEQITLLLQEFSAVNAIGVHSIQAVGCWTAKSEVQTCREGRLGSG